MVDTECGWNEKQYSVAGTGIQRDVSTLEFPSAVTIKSPTPATSMSTCLDCKFFRTGRSLISVCTPSTVKYLSSWYHIKNNMSADQVSVANAF